MLESISNSILQLGIMGIAGSVMNVWPNLSFMAIGSIAAVFARVFHSWYLALQAKQDKIKNEHVCDSKLAMMIEEEVIKRLNTHRMMRRIFGYCLMILYYAANIYYCVKFLFLFDDQANYDWALSFAYAMFIEYALIESIIIFTQIEAVNYLKTGGSQVREVISKSLISASFLQTFN